MPINVIHIVNNLEKVNFGIWNAAIFTSTYLRTTYKINSILCVCSPRSMTPQELDLNTFFIGSENSAYRNIEQIIEDNFYLPYDTIIVTHGCWSNQTRLGYKLKRKGFYWMYTPHGMLEPWSMKQKRFKKLLYFLLFEKRYTKHSDIVRAVSEAERLNLQKRFTQPILKIENGIRVTGPFTPKNGFEMVFLFMARLHYKKGILPLVKAWNNVMKETNRILIIAGPDEGELEKIGPYLCGNIQYVGPVYGDQKLQMLRRAHYYILPSYSEGFPTSVVEAMGFGLIPIVTEGCNFPAVFNESLGFKIEPNEESISSTLKLLETRAFDAELSLRNHQYVLNHNSERILGDQLYACYKKLLQ